MRLVGTSNAAKAALKLRASAAMTERSRRVQKGAIGSQAQSDPSEVNDVRNVLDLHRQLIARNFHAQMTAHSYEAATQNVVEVSRGFTALKPST